MPGQSESPVSRGGDKFKQLDELKTASGLKGIISQRVETGVITFAIIREYPSYNGLGTTSFVPENLMDDTIQLVQDIKNRIAEIRKTGQAPQATRARRG